MRLDKYLAETLNISRSEATTIIKQKKVKIDDRVAKSGSEEVKGKVYYNEEEIVYKEFRYFMINKPKGYVSASRDDKNPCVVDLVTGVKNLKAAGRLDIDTTGLMILTNDGAFIHKVTSPKQEIYKTYEVECDKEFKREFVSAFLEGFDLIDTDGSIYHTKKAYLEITSKNKALISICEGRFHEIKKMCHEVGLVVTNLKRIKIGSLELDSALKEGEAKELEEKDIEKIFVK